MSWEERMSAKHRPTYPTDPVPETKPPRWSRWFVPAIRWRLFGVLIPKPPQFRCRTCFEWKTEWKFDGEVWVPAGSWWMVCRAFSVGCDHRHHKNDVFYAGGQVASEGGFGIPPLFVNLVEPYRDEGFIGPVASDYPTRGQETP